ncbi:MAG: hypothetical protein M9962_05170 [Oligoflexia bacterium]|nr:hypothetical protein [Oligoflexia bacterium]
MYKKIIALVILFIVAYLGAHFYIRESRQIKTDTTILTRLVDCEPNSIKKMKIRNERGEVFEFIRTDLAIEGMPSSSQFAFAEWQVETPKNGEGDTQSINRLASMTCESFNPVPISEEDWKSNISGLSNIVYMELETIKDNVLINFAKVHSDKTIDIEVKIGNKNSSYYRVPAKIFTLINAEENGWKNYKITKMPNDSIQIVSVFYKNQEKFTLEREGVSWRKKIDSVDKGLASDEANKYVNRISTLKAIEIKNPSFGKDNCESQAKDFKIVFRGLNNNSEVIVLNKNKDNLFACSSLRDSEFVVHKDLLKYLPINIK